MSAKVPQMAERPGRARSASKGTGQMRNCGDNTLLAAITTTTTRPHAAASVSIDVASFGESTAPADR